MTDQFANMHHVHLETISMLNKIPLITFRTKRDTNRPLLIINIYFKKLYINNLFIINDIYRE